MVPFSDISSRYNVKPSLISYLLYQVKKDPEYLRSKMSKVDNIEKDRQIVEGMGKELLE